jgi:uncharacterized repeat protein (TIGR03847 family)
VIDFGLVDAVDAEAIGEPGQRTFRVRARAGVNYAALWLEKEQLAALGRGISQLLAERSLRRGEPVPRATAMGDFVARPDVEMEIVRLGIDFEPSPDRLILLADDQRGLERGDTPTFRMEMSRAAAIGLVREITTVVAAGRPRCPMCGRPMEADGQHFCPGSDGHSTVLEIPGPDEPTAEASPP